MEKCAFKPFYIWCQLATTLATYLSAEINIPLDAQAIISIPWYGIWPFTLQALTLKLKHLLFLNDIIMWLVIWICFVDNHAHMTFQESINIKNGRNQKDTSTSFQKKGDILNIKCSCCSVVLGVGCWTNSGEGLHGLLMELTKHIALLKREKFLAASVKCKPWQHATLSTSTYAWEVVWMCAPLHIWEYFEFEKQTLLLILFPLVLGVIESACQVKIKSQVSKYMGANRQGKDANK